jgi:hypothetical protein
MSFPLAPHLASRGLNRPTMSKRHRGGASPNMLRDQSVTRAGATRSRPRSAPRMSLTRLEDDPHWDKPLWDKPHCDEPHGCGGSRHRLEAIKAK